MYPAWTGVLTRLAPAPKALGVLKKCAAVGASCWLSAWMFPAVMNQAGLVAAAADAAAGPIMVTAVAVVSAALSVSKFRHLRPRELGPVRKGNTAQFAEPTGPGQRSRHSELPRRRAGLLGELGTIKLLSNCGVTVICAGGGGIPVVPGRGDQYRGVEAVVDKDGYGTAHPRSLRQITPGELRAYSFLAGSMGPKVEAACRFAERTGQQLTARLSWLCPPLVGIAQLVLDGHHAVETPDCLDDPLAQPIGFRPACHGDDAVVHPDLELPRIRQEALQDHLPGDLAADLLIGAAEDAQDVGPGHDSEQVVSVIHHDQPLDSPLVHEPGRMLH